MVMWKDAQGQNVIPCFASQEALDRALPEGMVGLALQGRVFLEAARGAPVVLNPNEPAHCRLSPVEVAELLDSGAVSSPELVTIDTPTAMNFAPVDRNPEALLHSLVVLYSSHPAVQEAFLVLMWPPERMDEVVYLICLHLDAANASEAITRETAAVLRDVPPDRGVDVLSFTDDQAPLLQDIRVMTKPFYARAMGERMVQPTSSTLT
jgi:hypothetical protein